MEEFVNSFILPNTKNPTIKLFVDRTDKVVIQTYSIIKEIELIYGKIPQYSTIFDDQENKYNQNRSKLTSLLTQLQYRRER